jgi:hypothetical protein
MFVELPQVDNPPQDVIESWDDNWDSEPMWVHPHQHGDQAQDRSEAPLAPLPSWAMIRRAYPNQPAQRLWVLLRGIVRPLLKQWWFWAVAGVIAMAIGCAIAAHDFAEATADSQLGSLPQVQVSSVVDPG